MDPLLLTKEEHKFMGSSYPSIAERFMPIGVVLGKYKPQEADVLRRQQDCIPVMGMFFCRANQATLPKKERDMLKWVIISLEPLDEQGCTIRPPQVLSPGVVISPESSYWDEFRR